MASAHDTRQDGFCSTATFLTDGRLLITGRTPMTKACRTIPTSRLPTQPMTPTLCPRCCHDRGGHGDFLMLDPFLVAQDTTKMNP